MHRPDKSDRPGQCPANVRSGFTYIELCHRHTSLEWQAPPQVDERAVRAQTICLATSFPDPALLIQNRFFQTNTIIWRSLLVLKLPEWVRLVCISILVLTAGRTTAANAQELRVPCEAFQRDVLGNWSATEQVSMDSPIGIVDIMPGHPVSVPMANVLNSRCG